MAELLFFGVPDDQGVPASQAMDAMLRRIGSLAVGDGGTASPSAAAPAGAAGAAAAFDSNQDYLYQDCLHGVEGRPAAAAGSASTSEREQAEARVHYGPQWVYMRFSQPVTATPDAIVIGSKLDADLNASGGCAGGWRWGGCCGGGVLWWRGVSVWGGRCGCSPRLLPATRNRASPERTLLLCTPMTRSLPAGVLRPPLPDGRPGGRALAVRYAARVQGEAAAGGGGAGGGRPLHRSVPGHVPKGHRHLALHRCACGGLERIRLAPPALHQLAPR